MDSDNWAIAIVALFIGIFLVAYVINGTKTNFRGEATCIDKDISTSVSTDGDGNVTTTDYYYLWFEDTDHLEWKVTVSTRFSWRKVQVGDDYEIRIDGNNCLRECVAL